MLPMQDELGRHWGLSMRVNDTPILRVARPRITDGGSVAGDRQRFTTIHELGHVAIHASTPPPVTSADAKKIESQANRFAAAFLAPAGPLMEDLAELGGAVTLKTLSQIKQKWGVAIKMLVVRFQQLEVIRDDHARSLYKQISARGWNRAEPVEVGHERALWLEKAVAKRYGDGGMRSLSMVSGLAACRVEPWRNWDPLDVRREPAEVVPLQRRSGSGGASGRDASIIQLPRR